ncbi:CPBP family intramembrane glutamic endopeptidase [Niabella insulamsoli]|uniref:CPBP family intramembrane glutamic endopeptidase n=1 Tax=Niabella insulamsoli TaxID=3144874 RepID=UPI0031FD7D84
MIKIVQRTVRDVGAIAFLIAFPHFVPLPFYSYAIVCFLVIWFLLRNDGKTFRSIGLSKNALTAKAVLIGMASALLWIGFMQFIYIPVIKHLFVVPDYTEYDFIKGNILNLLMIITAAWLIGGFYEEVVFRGYIQNILRKRFFKGAPVLWSVIATSILFGLYHSQQDVFGIAAAALGGLFWGILYTKFDNNLWIPIISHAIFDTITLLLIYFDRFGNLI